MEFLKQRMWLGRRLLVHGALGAAAGCVPDLDVDESTVRAPRLLAVQAEPAEVAPGSEAVVYRALIADASGARDDAAITWFDCLAQKPLAELGPVSRECLRIDSGKLTMIGQGMSVSAPVPSTACALFGPNPPPPMADQPSGRPVDPDETGGYKMPVVLGLSVAGTAAVELYEQRISCGLAGVSPDVSVEYALRYHRNENPSVRELRVTRASGEVSSLGDQPLQVAARERVLLEVAWPDCPGSDVCGDGVCGPDETRESCADDCTQMHGCGGQERYLEYDRQQHALTVRREAMRAAWYATAGTYDQERTGVAEQEIASGSQNGWVAPEEPGSYTLWTVLRDARGGVGAHQTAVVVSQAGSAP